MSSMNSIMLNSGLGKPIKALCNNSLFYQMDDSMIEISLYIFQCYIAINKYIKNNLNSMPFHIDLWIKPDKVYSVDDDDNCLENTGKMKNVHCVHVIQSDINDNIDELYNLHTKIYKLLMKILKGNRRYQRCCILINNTNKKMGIYFPPKTINEIWEKDTNKFVNESLFDNSINYILPEIGGCKSDIHFVFHFIVYQNI